MKKIGVLFIIFVGSFILPLLNVNAVDGYIGFLQVKIPKSSSNNWYSGLNYKKTQTSVQTYENLHAYTDDLLQSEREIKVRTWDGSKNSSWLYLKKGERKYWTQATVNSANFMPGTYAVDISRASTGTSNLVHNGQWWLNENLIP